MSNSLSTTNRLPTGHTALAVSGAQPQASICRPGQQVGGQLPTGVLVEGALPTTFNLPRNPGPMLTGVVNPNERVVT
jgi:hypothetical protein